MADITSIIIILLVGTASGYKTYTAIDDKFIGCFGHIHSPNFPKQYANGDSGKYNITVPDGHFVTLRVQFLDLESSQGCTDDYVALYDGPSYSYPLIMRICGHGVNREYKASGNTMFVHFMSNSQVAGLGFQLAYYATAESSTKGKRCQGANDPGLVSACSGGFKFLTFRSGTLETDGYPRTIQKQKYCNWAIDASSYGSSITLTWGKYFTIQMTYQCTNYLAIIHPEPNQPAEVICESKIPETRSSRGPYLFFSFRTPKVTSSRGFQVSYSVQGSRFQTATFVESGSLRLTSSQTRVAGQTTTPMTTQGDFIMHTLPPHVTAAYQIQCDKSLTVDNSQAGYIYSPGYPQMYPSNCQSSYTFILPKGYQKYYLFAQDFVIGVHADPCIDSITIKEVNAGDQHGPYCGSENKNFGHEGHLVIADSFKFIFRTPANSYKYSGVKVYYEAVKEK